MNDLVLIQDTRPIVNVMDSSTITILDSPEHITVEQNGKIIVSNTDLPVIVKYQTQKGQDGHTPTNEEIIALITPEYLISKLTGQIKATELYGSLASRINTISYLESDIFDLKNAVSLAVTTDPDGTYNLAAILADYSTQATTDAAIVSSRNALLAQTNNNIATAISDYSANTDISGAVATKVDTMIASTGNSLGNLSASLQVEQKVRAQTIAPLWVINKEYQKGETVMIGDITDPNKGKLYQCYTEVTDPANMGLYPPDNITLIPTKNHAHWKLIEANLYSQYMVKTDNNGNVAGFGLANDGATSEFIVLADRFSISSANDTINTAVPFIVTGGVVYINSAMIKDATITDAKIGDTIQSTLYTPGAGGVGWKIDKAGTIRGQGLIVEDASITALKIAGNSIWVTDYLNLPENEIAVTAGAASNWSTIAETPNLYYNGATATIFMNLFYKTNYSAASGYFYYRLARSDGTTIFDFGNLAPIATWTPMSSYTFTAPISLPDGQTVRLQVKNTWFDGAVFYTSTKGQILISAGKR